MNVFVLFCWLFVYSYEFAINVFSSRVSVNPIVSVSVRLSVNVFSLFMCVCVLWISRIKFDSAKLQYISAIMISYRFN